MKDTAPTWPAGYARHVHEVLDSTLTEAHRQRDELSGPTWIMAHEQTHARGRRGRSWATPRGNFASTLVLPNPGSALQAAQRSFVAALALYRAFVLVTGQARAFQLKWPNDVLLNGGKVAGILLEREGDTLVIGIGVNLTHAPSSETLEEGALPAKSLRDNLGATVDAEVFLTALAAEYAAAEEAFCAQGFEPIRLAWLEQAAKRGEVITARTMTETHVGTFEDVDGQGNLILRTAAGRVSLPAGEVYF